MYYSSQIGSNSQWLVRLILEDVRKVVSVKYENASDKLSSAVLMILEDLDLPREN